MLVAEHQKQSQVYESFLLPSLAQWGSASPGREGENVKHADIMLLTARAGIESADMLGQRSKREASREAHRRESRLNRPQTDRSSFISLSGPPLRFRSDHSPFLSLGALSKTRPPKLPSEVTITPLRTSSVGTVPVSAANCYDLYRTGWINCGCETAANVRTTIPFIR